MGVLEDAIREHLDLKRRHGASDEELTQQEADALGPARRDLPEDAEVVDGAEGEEASEAAPAGEPEPPVDTDPVEPGLATEPVEPPPVEPVEPAEPAPEASAPVDQDTAIYSPGDAPAPPEEDADLDFGEHAPEHKPSRDPDFE